MISVKFQNRQMNSSNPRAAEKFVLETWKLQIFLIEFNSMFKWTLWLFQLVGICVAVFAICGAVWGEGQYKIHMAMSSSAIIVIQTIVYGKLASVFDSSISVLMEWRRYRGNSWFARFFRSTPPIRVLLGSYFYVDKQLVLTSLSIIAENAVNLLVSRRG